MKRLYLLRHAKSSWDDPSVDDHDRPLAPRGRKAAARVAKHMRRTGIAPDLVLCSSARRARETLEGLGPALGEDVTVRVEPRLYGADAESLLRRLRRVGQKVDSVMLIGHNPSLQTLALALTAEGPDRSRVEEKFPTGALATLGLPSPRWADVEEGAAELVDFVAPKDLQRRG